MSGETKKKPEKKPSQLLGPPEGGMPAVSSADEFLERHQRARFVIDFFDSKHYAARNVFLDMKHRVLEAAKLMCWANCCDYVADQKGIPVGVTEIAALIGAPTQRVSEACKKLDEECLFRIVGRIIFVIDDPELERRKRHTKGEPFPNPYGKPDLVAEALDFWKEHDPDSFKRYQKADSKVKKTTRVLLVRQNRRRVLENDALKAYRDSRAKKGPDEPMENEAVSHPVRETKSRPKPRPVRETVPDPSGKDDGASLYGFKVSSKELASYETQIREAVTNSGLSDLPGNLAKAVRLAAERLAKVPTPHQQAVLDHYRGDLRQLASRRENKPKSWGIVVSAMEDAIDAIREKPQKPPAAQPVPESEPSIEDQISTFEGLLATSPTHPQAADWSEQLRKLRQRKPAESESHAKAQKAGQA